MDIKLEAPGHKNQIELQDYCSQILNKKFGNYPFLKNVDVKFVEEGNKTKVSILFKPEKSVMNYVSHEDANEHKAFTGAIAKMKVLIEKYKEKHYHSVHNK